MLRSLAIPAALIGLVLIPFAMPESKVVTELEHAPVGATHSAASNASANPFSLASAPVYSQTPGAGVPFTQNATGVEPAQNPAHATSLYGSPASASPGSGGEIGWSDGYSIPPGTPDYGSAETYYLPGDAMGPDLTAQPLSFLPVSNLEEIFRFDATPQWVTQRWQRVSSAPSEPGLQGLRTALVTGTNSWDLHGSLTYYFDGNQKCQRISFRGWAGDPSRLIQLLQQNFGFRSQSGSSASTAGFYLAKHWRTRTGGLLMKYPTVKYSENHTQQIAVLLEINQKGSSWELSDDFESLIRGAKLAN